MTEEVRGYGIQVEGLDFDTAMILSSVYLAKEMQSLGTEHSYNLIDLMVES